MLKPLFCFGRKLGPMFWQDEDTLTLIQKQNSQIIGVGALLETSNVNGKCSH